MSEGMTCCPLEGCDEYSAWSSITKPRARIAHDCEECGKGAIKPGDLYERSVQGSDGDISVYKTCLSCAEIRRHFACNGWIWGQLWSDLRQNFMPGMVAGGPCMEGLSPAAKARLFESRLVWWEGLDANERKQVEAERVAARKHAAALADAKDRARPAAMMDGAIDPDDKWSRQ
jgi:hypothetical protein